ncbi:uncharacterized protein LOC121763972 isoform X2 [Salvia splendens]|nr:uncharacterized protein LOC121763972 isoform X2 [Salvia splendens]
MVPKTSSLPLGNLPLGSSRILTSLRTWAVPATFPGLALLTAMSVPSSKERGQEQDKEYARSSCTLANQIGLVLNFQKLKPVPCLHSAHITSAIRYRIPVAPLLAETPPPAAISGVRQAR